MEWGLSLSWPRLVAPVTECVRRTIHLESEGAEPQYRARASIPKPAFRYPLGNQPTQPCKSCAGSQPTNPVCRGCRVDDRGLRTREHRALRGWVRASCGQMDSQVWAAQDVRPCGPRPQQVQKQIRARTNKMIPKQIHRRAHEHTNTTKIQREIQIQFSSQMPEIHVRPNKRTAGGRSGHVREGFFFARGQNTRQDDVRAFQVVPNARS